MSKPLRKRTKIILFLLLFCSAERFCHWQTGGFIISKMLQPPTVSGTSVPLFSEPLTFLGSGNQFYAFETADGRYVVKFMKFSRRRPIPWLEKLPLPLFLDSWRNSYLAQRSKRLSHLEKSSSLALRDLQQETGLVPLPQLQQTVTLVDKLGIRHTIDLSRTQFFLQKKAQPFTSYFLQNPSQSQSLLTSYIKTVGSQCSKGICNLDPMLERNFGVADNRMIVLDIGSFLSNEKLKTKTGLQRQILLELLPLREWLQKNGPQRLDFFDAQLQHEMLLQRKL
jgi:hypothetical protein